MLIVNSWPEESSRNSFRFSVAGDSVESASSGILSGEAVILFGSMSRSPAVRRLAGDSWQSQRVNHLTAGLKPRRLELPSHDAELIFRTIPENRAARSHARPARREQTKTNVRSPSTGGEQGRIRHESRMREITSPVSTGRESNRHLRASVPLLDNAGLGN